MTTPATIHGVTLDMAFICAVRGGHTAPTGSATMSLAGTPMVVLKTPSGSFGLISAGLWLVSPRDSKVIINQQYFMPPNSEQIGQPVSILEDVTEADITVLWLDRDWCSEYTGDFRLKVNGEIVWEKLLDTQPGPTGDAQKDIWELTVPPLQVDIKSALQSIFKPKTG